MCGLAVNVIDRGLFAALERLHDRLDFQFRQLFITVPAVENLGSSGFCVGSACKKMDMAVSSGVTKLQKGDKLMSTSLLYHGWGIRGYQELAIRFHDAAIHFSVKRRGRWPGRCSREPAGCCSRTPKTSTMNATNANAWKKPSPSTSHWPRSTT